ncbi:MAG: hypothetical protein E6I14_02575 [Chloroflexi bacterium]|nr:MAG: hypothetical protein E6I14_02575 [Chloroflexota bacterium]
MEFQDVVRKRKMVRSFEDRPIPRETVERIVANVQRAPSGDRTREDRGAPRARISLDGRRGSVGRPHAGHRRSQLEPAASRFRVRRDLARRHDRRRDARRGERAAHGRRRGARRGVLRRVRSADAATDVRHTRGVHRGGSGRGRPCEDERSAVALAQARTSSTGRRRAPRSLV